MLVTVAEKLDRKADQEDELAALATLDGDYVAARKHYEKAKALRRQARDARG